jgi:mannan endo-1,4-beta-mannosidase
MQPRAGAGAQRSATAATAAAEECSDDDDDAFVRVEGTRFLLRGAPWAVAGANCHYLPSWAADTAWCRAHVDTVLDAAAALRLNTLRVWAFADGAQQWHALQPARGVFCEQSLEGLDLVVAGAKARGLRLILPLLNYWRDYGGMDVYNAWCGHDAGCREEEEVARASFYSCPRCRAAFVAAVAALTARVNTRTGVRYRDEPTIMAWELCNEARFTCLGRSIRLVV